MAIPPVPNPCPTLKPGLALGAPEHAGFVSAFNWLIGIFRAAKENFTFSVNGASGDVSIEGGEGIAVSTSGRTIIISLGEGDTSDKEPPPDTSGGGPGDLSDPDDGGDPTDVPGGGGDEPSSGGGVPDCATGAFSYDFTNKCIRDGVVMLGRQAVRVSGVPATDGEWRVRVSIGSSSCTLEQGSGFDAPTEYVSYIPVMTLSGGDVVEDLRGAFVVPMYE